MKHVETLRTLIATPDIFVAPGCFDGLSARLNKVLVYDKQLASDVVSFQWQHEQAGTFVIWATARPGAPLPQVEQIVTDEIARLAREGPTPSATTTSTRSCWYCIT